MTPTTVSLGNSQSASPSTASRQLREHRLALQRMIASAAPARMRASCTADLRPNPAAARLILIPQHIDKLIGAVGSGPLDARALDLQRVVLLAGPSADAGETDAT